MTKSHFDSNAKTNFFSFSTNETKNQTVKIFDLKKPLEPSSVYAPILCNKSASFHGIATTLCIHDLNKDVFVSGSIVNNGVWEKAIMGRILILDLDVN